MARASEVLENWLKTGFSKFYAKFYARFYGDAARCRWQPARPMGRQGRSKPMRSGGQSLPLRRLNPPRQLTRPRTGATSIQTLMQGELTKSESNRHGLAWGICLGTAFAVFRSYETDERCNNSPGTCAERRKRRIGEHFARLERNGRERCPRRGPDARHPWDSGRDAKSHFRTAPV